MDCGVSLRETAVTDWCKSDEARAPTPIPRTVGQGQRRVCAPPLPHYPAKVDGKRCVIPSLSIPGTAYSCIGEGLLPTDLPRLV